MISSTTVRQWKLKTRGMVKQLCDKKITEHEEHKYWKIIPIEDVPDRIYFLDSAGIFKRKENFHGLDLQI